MVALREGENGWDGYVEKPKRVQLNISARIATITMSSERTSGSKRSTKILFSVAAAEQETEQALRPPPHPAGGVAMRHQYTRAELESITQETAIYIEGAGIAQLQWGGLEIAEGCRDGYLYCKHIKPFAMELYNRYWTAWDGPPEEEI